MSGGLEGLAQLPVSHFLPEERLEFPVLASTWSLPRWAFFETTNPGATCFHLGELPGEGAAGGLLHRGERPAQGGVQATDLEIKTLNLNLNQGGVQREEGGGYADLLLHPRPSLPRAGGQGCIVFNFILPFHFIFLSKVSLKDSSPASKFDSGLGRTFFSIIKLTGDWI